MKVDKDMSITLKLGMVVGGAVAVFLAGQWSQDKLRDLSGLQEEVRAVRSEVQLLRREFTAFNEDFTRKEKLNAAVRSATSISGTYPPYRRPEVQPGGSRQAMSRLGTQ